MGLLLQNDSIVLSDANGNVRFSTDSEMPHLITSASGSISTNAVTGVASYKLTPEEYSSTLEVASFTGSLVTRHTMLTHPSIIAGSESFITPFITLNTGAFQTGSGQVMSAMGSSIIDLYIQDDGNFAGSVVLNIEVSTGKVELVVRSELESFGSIVDHALSPGPPVFICTNSSGGVCYGSNTQYQNVSLNSSGFNITYKIYYGRFN